MIAATTAETASAGTGAPCGAFSRTAEPSTSSVSANVVEIPRSHRALPLERVAGADEGGRRSAGNGEQHQVEGDPLRPGRVGGERQDGKRKR